MRRGNSLGVWGPGGPQAGSGAALLKSLGRGGARSPGVCQAQSQCCGADARRLQSVASPQGLRQAREWSNHKRSAAMTRHKLGELWRLRPA